MDSELRIITATSIITLPEGGPANSKLELKVTGEWNSKHLDADGEMTPYGEAAFITASLMGFVTIMDDLIKKGLANKASFVEGVIEQLLRVCGLYVEGEAKKN